MPRERFRTQACGRAEARTRLAQARKFLEVAELVATEREIDESASVAAALAVLAGIAAADAASCGALGRRSRSQDHRDATALIAQIAGGNEMATALGRLLDVKDTAQYGLINLSGQQLSATLRRARRLVEFADALLHR